MENKERQSEKTVGEMHKRRETMPDGKRYIIYYTFGDEFQSGAENAPASSSGNQSEVKENV